MPLKVFISYRRSDSAAWADRLLELLIPEFSRENVFLDIDGSIPAGFSWKEWIDQRVAECDLMLVLIGPFWGEEFGRRSGPQDRDYVRLEIERALYHRIPVVPVRLGDAALPAADALPQSIRRLLDLEARHLGRGERFRADAEELIRAVKSSIGLSRKQKEANRQVASFVLAKLERELVAAGMPSVDARLTIDAFAGYSSYLERGGSSGVSGLIKLYDRVPDFADTVDVEKATSALNSWFGDVGGDGQLGYVSLDGELSSSWVFVDWKGDEIADRAAARPIRILRPAIFSFADGTGPSCGKAGKVLAVAGQR
jgi:hypothetical protein